MEVEWDEEICYNDNGWEGFRYERQSGTIITYVGTADEVHAVIRRDNRLLHINVRLLTIM